jgi:hypothetical protein
MVPLLVGKDFGHEVFHRRQKHGLCLDPKYDDDSDYWSTLFREERGAALK